MFPEIKSKTLQDLVGKLFFIGIPGPELDPETLGLLGRVRPAGVCLFARNIKSLQQTRDLTDSLREVLGPELLISIDQEGGRVDRLRRIIEPMPAVSQLRSVEQAKTHAKLSGLALSMLGINMNFAPVVDVARGGSDSVSNGLETRTFGANAHDVVLLAEAYLAEIRSLGLRTCLKHFPGLGKSATDSHERLPTVDLDLEEFETVDLLPYSALNIDGATTAVMVGHAAYPKLPFQETTPDGRAVPSSLGRSFIRDLLRASLGFDGVVITDDLEMGAVLESFGIGDACVRAIEAGNDMLLICNESENINRGFDRVVDAVSSTLITEDAVTAALSRTCRLTDTLPQSAEFDPSAFEGLSADIREFKAQLQRS